MRRGWLRPTSTARKPGGRWSACVLPKAWTAAWPPAAAEPTASERPGISRLTHQLRAAHDAILVGVGTVLADNPQLTVRLVEGRNPQPVILDSRLRTPTPGRPAAAHLPAGLDCHDASRSDPERRAALESAGARLLVLPARRSRPCDLPALLDCLAEDGVRSLMVEGGAQVITSFLAQRLADWVSITIAPVILGGLPAVEPCLAGPSRLTQVHTGQLGEDVVIFGRLL